MLRQGVDGQQAEKKGGTRIFFALNEMDTFRETLVGGAAERAAQEGVQMDVGDAQGSIENKWSSLSRRQRSMM